MKGKDVVHSKAATGGRDDWLTPPKILNPLLAYFGKIGYDVATSTKNPTNAVMIATAQRSGLIGNWILPTDAIGEIAGAYNFGNPPYSMADRFVRKAALQAERGCETFFLVASRTGSAWFQPCFEAQAIGWVRGRLFFPEADTGRPAPTRHPKKLPNGKRNPLAGVIKRNGQGEEIPQSAPFDSALVYWGHRPTLFQKAFASVATVKLFSQPVIAGTAPELYVA